MKEIFNIPVKKEDQYKRGKSANQPDEIRSKTGTYHLWLNASSRTSFHEALDACIDLLRSLPRDTSSIDSDQDDDSEDANDDSDVDNNGVNDTPAPQVDSPKGKVLIEKSLKNLLVLNTFILDIETENPKIILLQISIRISL